MMYELTILLWNEDTGEFTKSQCHNRDIAVIRAFLKNCDMPGAQLTLKMHCENDDVYAALCPDEH